MEPVSLYVHIPFCRKRCNYCDFLTCAGIEHLIPPYVDALCREAEAISRSSPTDLNVHTIYFGGGTPSLLPPAQYRLLLDTFSSAFFVSTDCEITTEANPGTVSLEYLEAIRGLGINRLSFGVQSFIPEELSLLGRIHSSSDIPQSIQWAREAGFENLNLDLIYGLPYQSLANWQRTLDQALQFEPEHISLYSLVIEPGTPFSTWLEQGRIPKPDDDLAADMYEWAMDSLSEQEYEHYEISNWAKHPPAGQSYQCRHNLQYWRNRPYCGLGAGAHGCLQGYRLENTGEIEDYIQRCSQPSSGIFPFGPATIADNPVDVITAMQETMMLGLRLTQEGVDRRQFRQRFGRELIDVFGKEIQSLTNLQLLEWSGAGLDHLHLTRRGRLLGNQVFMHFVD